MLAEEAGSKPQTQGFDLDNSVSTSSSSLSSTAPQEVLDSQGAIVLAKAEDSRWEAEEEEEEDDNEDAEDDSPCAPPSSTTAATIPSNTMDTMTYEVVGDDATVDSTVVEEEREVLVAVTKPINGAACITTLAIGIFLFLLPPHYYYRLGKL